MEQQNFNRAADIVQKLLPTLKKELAQWNQGTRFVQSIGVKCDQMWLSAENVPEYLFDVIKVLTIKNIENKIQSLEEELKSL